MPSIFSAFKSRCSESSDSSSRAAALNLSKWVSLAAGRFGAIDYCHADFNFLSNVGIIHLGGIHREGRLSSNA